MKKNFINGCLLVSTLTVLAACSSSDSHHSIAERIHTPNSDSGSRVRSISYTGYYSNVTNWSFSYVGTALTYAQGIGLAGQMDPNDGSGLTQLSPRNVTYSLSYGSTYISVGVSGNSQQAVNLILANDLLASATSGNTTYDYAYTNGRLTAWGVTYQNSGFGEQPTKGASASISWSSDGNIEEIHYVPSTDASNKYYTYKLEYSSARNVNGLLPEKISEAFGCEGFEYLYYAGLLGKATTNLPSKLTITYSLDEDDVREYDFAYNPTNGTDVLICQYGPAGRMVNVAYAY